MTLTREKDATPTN